MCGRFTQTKSRQDVKKRFNVTKVPEATGGLYNVAPDADVPVILNAAPGEVSLARWGLVPSWSKEPKSAYSMINARAETLLEKPSYKRLIAKRRCLVIADSFYEWKKADGKKQPYRIMLNDEGLFAFAGLWDLWEKEGNALISCSIITTSPNALVSKIHDRMPVILPQELEEAWLSDIPVEQAMAALRSYDAGGMKAYPVSTAVNNPSNNAPEIIVPVGE